MVLSFNQILPSNFIHVLLIYILYYSSCNSPILYKTTSYPNPLLRSMLPTTFYTILCLLHNYVLITQISTLQSQIRITLSSSYISNVCSKTLLDHFNLCSRNLDHAFTCILLYSRRPCCHQSIGFFPHTPLFLFDLPTKTSITIPTRV